MIVTLAVGGFSFLCQEIFHNLCIDCIIIKLTSFKGVVGMDILHLQGETAADYVYLQIRKHIFEKFTQADASNQKLNYESTYCYKHHKKTCGMAGCRSFGSHVHHSLLP